MLEIKKNPKAKASAVLAAMAAFSAVLGVVQTNHRVSPSNAQGEQASAQISGSQATVSATASGQAVSATSATTQPTASQQQSQHAGASTVHTTTRVS